MAVDHAFYKILSMQNRMLASFAFRGGMLFNRFFQFHVLQWIIPFYIPIQQHVLFYMQVPTTLRQISHFHLSLSPVSFLSIPIFLFCLKDGTSPTTSLHLLLASMSSKSDLFRKKPYILINIHIIYIYIKHVIYKHYIYVYMYTCAYIYIYNPCISYMLCIYTYMFYTYI